MEEMAEKPNLLKDLGETAIFLRDGVIGILALAYGLGLVVWSIYAANAGIVLSQVVDLQYFVAGIIPALVLGATYIILKRRVSPKNKWLLLVVAGFVALALAYVVLDALRVYRIELPIAQETLVYFLKWSVTVLFLLTLPIFAMMDVSEVTKTKSPEGGTEERRRKSISMRMAVMSLLAFPIGLIFYALYVYPYLPQALGGAQPRCALINFDESKAKTFFQIGDAAHLTRSSDGTATMKAVVLYASEDTIYLRPYAETPNSNAHIYEIRRDAFDAIAWCGDFMEPPKVEEPKAEPHR